jgi:hypothetical protein
VYTDEDTLRQFGRLTRIYAALAANYTRAAVRQNAAEHTPVMRPLFLMFEDDPQSFLQAGLKPQYVRFFCQKTYIYHLYCYQTMIKFCLLLQYLYLFPLLRFPFLSLSLIISNFICTKQVPDPTSLLLLTSF